MNHRYLLFLLCYIGLLSNLLAQAFDSLEWVHTWGDSGVDYAEEIVADEAGYIYLVG